MKPFLLKLLLVRMSYRGNRETTRMLDLLGMALMCTPLGPGVHRGQLSLRDEGMELKFWQTIHKRVHKDRCDAGWVQGWEENRVGHRLGVKCHHAVTV